MKSFGIIFDWDGVIIDSSSAHEKSWDLLAQETGLPLPKGHFKKGFGRKNEYIIPHILGWKGVPEQLTEWAQRKEQIYREIIRCNGIELLPGVENLLQELKEAQVPVAIGSSTCLQNIEAVMEVTGIRHFFQIIITAENVKEGKPNPEIFLLAAERLGLEPTQCLVIEDAQVGIQAAKAGGMKVLAVATSHSKDALIAADDIAHRLTEYSLLKIKALLKVQHDVAPFL